MENRTILRDNLLGIVSALAMFSSLYLVKNSLISTLGGVAAVGALFLCGLMWLANYPRIRSDFTTIIVLLIGLVVLVQIIWHRRLNALYPAMQTSQEAIR